MITRSGVYCLSAAAEGFLVPIGFAGAVLAVIDISARPEYNAATERMVNAAPRAEILHFGACPLAALKKIKFEKENLMAKDLTQQTWHGVPRKEIPWFPTVDYDACIGCGLCYLTCGRDVFELDDVNAYQKSKGLTTEW
jgi:Pyruvate/2-oxoacid:ferredoxin oxidoreductase delta subunit